MLVIGAGGREHAIAWRLAQDGHVVTSSPGNAGMDATGAERVTLDLSDQRSVVDQVKQSRVDMVVIGPEQPLADGLADRLTQAGIKTFGVGREAARLEGSKSFAKEVMVAAGVPTGDHALFDDADAALRYLDGVDGPVVVKADGLAAGKGVTVATDRDEAAAAVLRCLVDRSFGEAGELVLIEECLRGYEISMIALADEQTIVPLAPAQDFKRAGDGDTGPNTGGMGCYSPVPHFGDELVELAMERVLRPTLKELARRGIVFRGVIYAGLMMTDDGPKVLEFNCRFGDPETQAILPRLRGGFSDALEATADGRLSEIDIEWSTESCVDVVLASQGYPGAYPTGLPISGCDEASSREGVSLFHAGTESDDRGIVTSGGRVINVSALGGDLSEARTRAYGAVTALSFKGMHYRTDIAESAASLVAAGERS